jgi:hypothetical protein
MNEFNVLFIASLVNVLMLYINIDEEYIPRIIGVRIRRFDATICLEG